jgi:hypothetical protein
LRYTFAETIERVGRIFMMTQQQIFKEISLLPLSEQFEIIEKIRRNAEQSAQNGADEDEFQRELSIKERVAIAMNLSGSLKPDGDYTPMTREEEREIIEEYLAEKYA